MAREKDSLEDYQIQGTYRPQPGLLQRLEYAMAAGLDHMKEAQKANAERYQDEQKNGHILGGTLDNAIREFSRQGFEITYKDATTCQMKQGKRFRGWQVIGMGVVTAGWSLVPHILQQAGRKDKIILLTLDAQGRVRLS